MNDLESLVLHLDDLEILKVVALLKVSELSLSVGAIGALIRDHVVSHVI